MIYLFIFSTIFLFFYYLMESNQQKPKDNSVFAKVGRWFSKKAEENAKNTGNEIAS